MLLLRLDVQHMGKIPGFAPFLRQRRDVAQSHLYSSDVVLSYLVITMRFLGLRIGRKL